MTDELFWNIGYALLWQNGRRSEALRVFRQGLKLQPRNLLYWKTFLLAWLRTPPGERALPEQPAGPCCVNRG
jgi:hypothetical protein